MSDRKEFIRCNKCGKKLIVRTDSGLFHFAFGRVLDEAGDVVTVQDEDGREHPMPAVEMQIHGVVYMKCISKDCRTAYPDHWNKLSFFETKSMGERA